MPSGTDAGTKGNVLLVDDDQFLLDLYATKFLRSGYDVHVYLSAEKALDDLRSGLKPDVIITDIVMAELDGFAFLQTVRSEHLADGTPRIVLSNQSTSADLTRAAQLGVARLIIKATMTANEVVAVVDQLIAKEAST